ncbi:MAG TPA: extradiol dioxygenase [Candidatus Dormibacteraeota bacterium]|nr:extradiol dioxygenase [Candidatus Dormibacteraeota bacterium]
MITGAHAIIYSRDAEADRAFIRDVLGFSSVDAGDGWLIFALPPAEVALHPAETGGKHELFLLCDDIEAAAARLGITEPISEQRWGRLVHLKLPSGAELGLYQPKHARPTAITKG